MDFICPGSLCSYRQALRQQREGRDLALDCLRRRHRDVAIVQRLLEANIQYCSQAQVCPEARALHEAQSSRLQPHELGRDLQEVKTHLQSAMEKQESEQREASQGKEEWEEVLRRAEEWQREAERLVRLTVEQRGTPQSSPTFLSLSCFYRKGKYD